MELYLTGLESKHEAKLYLIVTLQLNLTRLKLHESKFTRKPKTMKLNLSFGDNLKLNLTWLKLLNKIYLIETKAWIFTLIDTLGFNLLDWTYVAKFIWMKQIMKPDQIHFIEIHWLEENRTM